MNIGFVIHNIHLMGGTERSACAVMNGLADKAQIHLIEVAGTDAPAYPLDPRINRTCLFTHPVSLLNSLPRLTVRLARLIRHLRLDALVIVESTHALYAVLAARIAGVRSIVWEHFNFNVLLGKKKRGWGRRVAARWANDVITLTQRDIALWTDAACPKAHITCIPNMAPAASNIFSPTAHTVMALGRLTTQKGFDRLLAAWHMIEADPRSTDWMLQIVGEGPQQATLSQQAEAMQRVRIEPPTKNVEKLYGEAGIVVSSSRYEGLPMVLLEACAYGIPVVAFDCETGPAEIITHGESGYLVPQGDIKGLAETLLQLMASPALRQKFSQAASKNSDRFSKTMVMQKWTNLLDIPN